MNLHKTNIVEAIKFENIKGKKTLCEQSIDLKITCDKFYDKVQISANFKLSKDIEICIFQSDEIGITFLFHAKPCK